MRRVLRKASLVFLLLLACGMAGADFEYIADLPPGEQYRQLSLILMISGGAEAALLKALEPAGGGAGPAFDPDDYKTPLFRIVDQQSMLSGAGFLLRFARQSRTAIEDKLAAIRAANPVLISMVDMNAVTEDAIIIRNAIADAVSYAGLAEDGAALAGLESYRNRTLRIRNIMEFEQFDRELQRLTAEAIRSVGGKLDAYQRMFDEEVDSKAFDRQFDAAKYIYNRTDKFDEEAGLLTEEIMKNVILSQSRPIP